MPETDVTKMKVADLKRELKLRGLPTAGNKTELQDRLQSSLLDGELSLEDTAISVEDLLDEDAVLTDEDEAKILGADEHDLLQSPVTTPTATSLDTTLDASGNINMDLLGSVDVPMTTKKIVLKRKNSFSSTNNVSAVTSAKENAEPAIPKVIKMSERNPITISADQKVSDTAASATSKIGELTLQQRLEMRAKKFGINTNAASAAVAATSDNAGGGDAQQIEMLKKRAERFGCVVSSKIAKLDAEEKLLKRKERFGGVAADPASNGNEASAATSNNTTGVWAEKARLRLERFKGTTNVATTPAASQATEN